MTKYLSGQDSPWHSFLPKRKTVWLLSGLLSLHLCGLEKKRSPPLCDSGTPLSQQKSAFSGKHRWWFGVKATLILFSVVVKTHSIKFTALIILTRQYSSDKCIHIVVQLISKIFQVEKVKLYTHKILALPLPKPLATIFLLSVFMALINLNTSYEWSHIVFDLLLFHLA